MYWSAEQGYVFIPNPLCGGYVSFDAWVLLVVAFVLVGVTALIVNRASGAKRITGDEEITG